MDLKELKKLIARGESQTLEFKAGFSNEAVETIAAFQRRRRDGAFRRFR